MKLFRFHFGGGMFVTYKGETMGQAILQFLRDGLHDMSRVVDIDEEG